MLVASTDCNRGFRQVNKYEVNCPELFRYKLGHLPREESSRKGSLGVESSGV